eukprot:CCRYP_003798-RA/>CCRYP_003798-RA protein AED:0.25 eAED:0.32 QI:0/0/0.5/1/0/0/2/850/113
MITTNAANAPNKITERLEFIIAALLRSGVKYPSRSHPPSLLIPYRSQSCSRTLGSYITLGCTGILHEIPLRWSVTTALNSNVNIESLTVVQAVIRSTFATTLTDLAYVDVQTV